MIWDLMRPPYWVGQKYLNPLWVKITAHYFLKCVLLILKKKLAQFWKAKRSKTPTPPNQKAEGKLLALSLLGYLGWPQDIDAGTAMLMASERVRGWPSPPQSNSCLLPPLLQPSALPMDNSKVWKIGPKDAMKKEMPYKNCVLGSLYQPHKQPLFLIVCVCIWSLL